MMSTVMFVATERASLQPPPAIIRRCRGLLALMISTYSESLTVSCLPPRPKYLGWSFSQMPMIARMVSSTEIPMPIGVMAANQLRL